MTASWFTWPAGRPGLKLRFGSYRPDDGKRPTGCGTNAQQLVALLGAGSQIHKIHQVHKDSHGSQAPPPLQRQAVRAGTTPRIGQDLANGAGMLRGGRAPPGAAAK